VAARAHPYALSEEEARVLRERLKALKEVYKGSPLEKADMDGKNKVVLKREQEQEREQGQEQEGLR
jgi:hypothetical protein